MARFKRARPESRAAEGARMISFRATAAEHAALHAAAKERGLKVADLLREALDEYLTRRKGRKTKGGGSGPGQPEEFRPG